MPKHLTRIEPVDTLPDPSLYEEGYPVLFGGAVHAVVEGAWAQVGGSGGGSGGTFSGPLDTAVVGLPHYRLFADNPFPQTIQQFYYWPYQLWLGTPDAPVANITGTNNYHLDNPYLSGVTRGGLPAGEALRSHAGDTVQSRFRRYELSFSSDGTIDFKAGRYGGGTVGGTVSIWLDGTQVASQTFTAAEEEFDLSFEVSKGKATVDFVFEWDGVETGDRIMDIRDFIYTPDVAPVAGEVYYDEVHDEHYVYDGAGPSLLRYTPPTSENYRTVQPSKFGGDAYVADIGSTVYPDGMKGFLTSLGANNTFSGESYDAVVAGSASLVGPECQVLGSYVDADGIGTTVIGGYSEASYGQYDVAIGQYVYWGTPGRASFGSNPVPDPITVNTGGLLPAGIYEYRLSAADVNGLPATAYPATQKVTIEFDGASADLTWDTATEDAGADHIRVFRLYRDSWELLGQVNTGVGTFTDNVPPGSVEVIVAEPAWWNTNEQWGWTETRRTGVGYSCYIDYVEDGTALGANTSVYHTHSTAVGADTSTTADNQLMLGTEADFVEAPGGLVLAVKLTNAAYTIDAFEKQTIVLADATSAAYDVTLPAVDAGRVVIVKKTDSSANAVTVVTPGAETIDGAASHALATQYDVVRLVSDGTNWFAI